MATNVPVVTPGLHNTRVVDIVRAPDAVLFDVNRALPRASVDGCL